MHGSCNHSHTLDISRDGVMSDEFARLFDRISDDLRNEYVEFVNDFSAQYLHDLNWFVTPFACRNTYVCDVFESLVRVVFVRSIASRHPDITTIVVDTPVLARLIRSCVPRSIIIKSKKNNINYYSIIFLDVLKGAIKYIVSAFLKSMSFRIASLIASDKSRNVCSKDVSIIETYLYSNSFDGGNFTDRHFCKLGTYLNGSQLGKLVYIPTFYNVRNYFSVYLSAIRSKERFFFVEQHINMFDMLFPLMHPFNLKFSHSGVIFRGLDISQLINHSLVRHCTNTSSLNSILKQRFCSNLSKQNAISINRIVRWYENQEIDHGSILGWRSYFESISVIGYMGYFSSDNYLCSFPMSIEYDLKMVPDCIGVMGKGLINQHKKYCNSLNIKVVPSFRFSVPDYCSHSNRDLANGIKVLVALPISENHIKIIINMIRAVTSFDHIDPLTFIIKPHPASQYNCGQVNSNNNVRYVVSEDSLHDLFGDVDFVMSFASSSLVEAIMHGKYAVLVSPTQSLRENIVPDFVPRHLWSEVYSAQELYDLINDKKYLNILLIKGIFCKKEVFILF